MYDIGKLEYIAVNTAQGERFVDLCTYVPNTNSYPQMDVTRICQNGSGISDKQLVHLIWWRWRNNFAQIDPTQTLSHLSVDKEIVDCIQENVEMNESRKYCHLFGWYNNVLPNEITVRCPHRENPCLPNKYGE